PPPPPAGWKADAVDDDSANAPSETVAAMANTRDLRDISVLLRGRAWVADPCFILPLVDGPRSLVHLENSKTGSRPDAECPFTKADAARYNPAPLPVPPP